jgi:hypothetical protein
VVLVVDRELVDVGVVELAGAATADPRVHLQSLAPVTLRALLASTARVGDQTVETGVVGIDSLAGGHLRIV